MRRLGLLLLALAACSMPTPAAQRGQALFSSPRLSDSAFNAFSCATCHAATAAPEAGRMPSGYRLHDSAFRRHFWGGYETRLLDAVNFCLVAFMRGQPLTEDQPDGKALYEYLVAISPSKDAPPLPFTVVRNVADVPRGGAARGAEVYAGACQSCHGEARSGRGRLTEETPVLPNIAEEYPAKFPGSTPALVVVEKVRHGQFFQVGGNMPPFSLEALSDADLGALLAFLQL